MNPDSEKFVKKEFVARFKAQLTVVLDFEADNEEEARQILQNMEYSFDRSPNKEEMDSEIIEIDPNL